MYKKIFLSCLSIFFLFGCKKDDPKLIVDIDDDFHVDLFEDISNGDQRFQLNITTIKEQTCINFEIDYDLDFDEQNNSIEITINELVEPEDCAQGTAFASVVIPFGALSDESFSLNLNLKDAVINTGRLFVTEEHYELDMNTNDGIEIVNEKLFRIPENTIWGYVAFDDNSASTDANNFISDLENISTITNVDNNDSFLPGYYGYFNLDDDKQVLINPESESNDHRSFIFNYEDGLSEIETLMDEACQNSSSDLKIHIFSRTGQYLSCP